MSLSEEHSNAWNVFQLGKDQYLIIFKTHMALSLISACPRRDPEPVFVAPADIFIGHDVVQDAETVR